MREIVDRDSASVSLPTCPHCGTPVATVTSRGPTEHYASPCGCRIRAGALERAEDRG
ncbi:hypothetical protein [Natronobeatus ordinarius]|uniref:hypothetical protein n=1 Tax=Natronobeatus ordinarius TaxID=2963433 RepID=UPI0020CC2799|nr:hypothetical protein [Natronobeatus ordinarius]